MKAKRKSTNPRTRQVLDTLRVVKRDVQKKLDIEALLVEMKREAQGVIDNTPVPDFREGVKWTMPSVLAEAIALHHLIQRTRELIQTNEAGSAAARGIQCQRTY